MGAGLTGSSLWPATLSSGRTRLELEADLLAETDILAALRDCFDPEVKLNLVDLGLIYGVATGPDPDSTPAGPRQWVKVTMTLTTPQCPASGLIFEQVNNRLAGMPEISKVEVDLVWEPPWTPYRISEAGRRQLGI
jgi:metal-sulfur cluster biosynthetic enzyme